MSRPLVASKTSYDSSEMLRLFVVILAFVYCEAVPGAGYGPGGYGQGGYGAGFTGLTPLLKGGLSTFSSSPIGAGLSSLPLTSGYGLGFGLSPYGGSPSAFALPAVPLAAPALPVAPILPPQPQVLEVAGDDQPVQVIFKSLGTRVNVQQIHTPSGPPQVEATRSEDEPHRVIHEVYRPVIQEIREVIQPYRRFTQEVRPVLEEVHTVVAKNANKFAAAGPATLTAGGGDYKAKSRKA